MKKKMRVKRRIYKESEINYNKKNYLSNMIYKLNTHEELNGQVQMLF